ncbi:acyl-CoA dehydrogenase family protein [Haliea sp.]|uniref:acyl-CoA dehydrogenase family protein n=1 Tax=Haliea TaxID=475794 RepID=UPI000C4E37E6|nr:acyl-CoA dehydrogenase family protein [Haliea sp.]HBM83107.1 pimeloyl-CoA dehydrogenase large subunit [Halieaceae bacterium]MAD62821.1 pimeloyl-CoA dehydrogenase large subunit [Haliea sp.]MAY94363.1 pimeloyl-CoA dehydrogenase large subunit [Haliea sp.]MBP69704.1 pimeloyl-CoA dehydrogenase large subunit [Haliea sp.]HCD55382.1 pimeloyl-CoA dehydrogenase large subunit [Halieaceae bacterium]
MDTSFAPEDLAFRDEVRAFFAEAYDADLQARLNNLETFKDAVIDWQKRLYKQGWIAPGWPKEYGGTGWNATQKFIFETERSAAGIRDVIPFGLQMVGPVIYAFGNDEQKARFLPGILQSDDWWCQGYSEPGAGSDLASLKTRAVREGDEYVVTGAKIWTSYAQYADWIFCLVRTSSEGKKQNGISFLLIDMKSPGIKVNPIVSIDNHHSLNEVEFNDVRVPVANLIGEQDKGWTYAKALLAHERTAIAGVADSKRSLAETRAFAEREINGGKSLLSDPLFQKRLSDIEIELMALEFTELRVLATVAAGGAPGAESSMLKIKGTEMQQAVQELRMDVAAYYQGVLPNDLTAEQLGHDFGSQARQTYMYGRASTIYGGSNEVQKNIIAKAVLGL